MGAAIGGSPIQLPTPHKMEVADEKSSRMADAAIELLEVIDW